MKKLMNHAVVLFFATLLFTGLSANKASAQGGVGVSISFQNFYDDLSPYGTWIDYPAYGHVWHPAITGEFRPYLTNGNWDYSNEGWMWTSNYNWGWAPFHYGRWVYDDLYGWLWIPGYEWSPAWVTWGMFDNFYAWAPLMPEVNVGIRFGSWRPAAMYWNVCGRDHIYDKDIYNVVERRDHVANYVSRINVINNFSTTRLHNQYYAKGPDVNEVQKFANHKIQAATIREVNTSGAAKRQGNEMQVYRPAITTPQPREFRRVDNNNSAPVRTNEDKVITERNQQQQNIERMPVHRAPASTFNAGQRNGNYSNHNRRN